MLNAELPMDLSELRDEDVIQYCHRHGADQTRLLSEAVFCRKVVKLTDDVVVKFGPGVTLQEASAQQLASQRVNQEVLRIPRVYRFFTKTDSQDQQIGYLVMERIVGANLEQIEWDKSDVLSQLVAALNAIHSITSEAPGPVSGGEACGSLWWDYDAGMEFPTIAELEAYLNERLAFFGTATQLRGGALCLCHMDIAPRNFMIDPQGRLCLVDWATAGFYPRYFELWAIEFSKEVVGAYFDLELLDHLQTTPREKLEIQTLGLVYRYNSHFGSRHNDDETEHIMAAISNGVVF